jgi:hypothetical protein
MVSAVFIPFQRLECARLATPPISLSHPIIANWPWSHSVGVANFEHDVMAVLVAPGFPKSKIAHFFTPAETAMRARLFSPADRAHIWKRQRLKLSGR